MNINPISRDASVFRSSENKSSSVATSCSCSVLSWKFTQSCTYPHSVVQRNATVRIYTTSNQSYCRLHHEIFISEEKENLHDRFLCKMLGHWCVWLPENMLYNNKWLRHALPLPLWNGTIHTTLSLCINIYRYETNIIKKIINTVHTRMTTHCVTVISIRLEQIFILECIIWHSSLAHKAE